MSEIKSSAATPGQAATRTALLEYLRELVSCESIAVDGCPTCNKRTDEVLAILAAQERPAPGDASAPVDSAIEEWLDRRTATALATAPGIDEREQGKRQGIDDLRQRLDDYWYTLTPAVLEALAAQERPAPGPGPAERDRFWNALFYIAGRTPEYVPYAGPECVQVAKDAIEGTVPPAMDAEQQAAPELAAAMAESRRYRQALQVIAGYAAGTATKQQIGIAVRRALEGK